MAERSHRVDRRRFLASAAGMSLAGAVPPSGFSISRPAVPRCDDRAPIAVLGTVYRPLSFAYHLAGRFLNGWLDGAEIRVPSQHVKTLWLDQHPDNDLSRELAKTFGFHRTRTISEALTAGSRLSVEAVLIAAEHGNYPRNDFRQVLSPRFEIVTQVIAAFHSVKQTAPVYLGLQLSHDFEKAKQIVAWSRQLGFPIMAGSPIPAATQSGDLNDATNRPLDEILVVGFGPMEAGGFDALEVMQCIAERRLGGETGIAAITCLVGQDVWKAGDTGKWNWDLLDEALKRSPTANVGDVRTNVGAMAVGNMPATPALAILVEYRDGLRASALLLNGHAQDFTAALRSEHRIYTGHFDVLPPPGLRHFDHLAAQVESFFKTGKSPNRIERNLLTSGAIESAMQSHARFGQRVETPHLAVSYTHTAS